MQTILEIVNKDLFQSDNNYSSPKDFTSQKLLHHKSFYFKLKFKIRFLQQICDPVIRKRHLDKFWENMPPLWVGCSGKITS